MSSILSKEQQDIRKANGKALLKAIKSEKNDEAIRLIKKGNIDLNFARKYGYTPLESACKKNNIALIKLLLEHGANVNFAIVDGKTPLYIACFRDRIEVAKLLLEHGANPNVMECRGFTPLSWALVNSNPVLPKLLLVAGAEVEKKYEKRQVIKLTNRQFSKQFDVIQKDDGSVRYLFKDRVKTTYDQILQEKLDKKGVIATDVAALFKQPEKVISLSGALHKAGFAQMLTQGDSKCLHKAVRTKENHAESNITCRNAEKATRRTFSEELTKASEKWADRTGDSFGIPLGLF